MSHQDPEMKMYAESGLRTAEDWASLGRVLETGAEARTSTLHRGKSLSLYGRDQTLSRAEAAAQAALTAQGDTSDSAATKND